MKTLIIVLLSTLNLFANQEIILLDSARYYYYDGLYYQYVWLSDDEKQISYIYKSNWPPEKFHFKELQERKTIINKPEIGAKIK